MGIEPTTIYSPKQIASYFDVHIHTVYGWLRSGELKSYRYGRYGHFRVKEEWLKAFEEHWLKGQEDCRDLLERKRKRMQA